MSTFSRTDAVMNAVILAPMVSYLLWMAWHYGNRADRIFQSGLATFAAVVITGGFVVAF